MQYLFVLGREPLLSFAELESVFGATKLRPFPAQPAATPCAPAPIFAILDTTSPLEPAIINRLGGTIKIAQILDQPLASFLSTLPKDHKLTLGFSDYSKSASKASTWQFALKQKHLLRRQGRSVRLVPNTSATLSAATIIYNRLTPNSSSHTQSIRTRYEIIRYNDLYAVTLAVQDISAYAKRDHARPARDAFVGMLPPKLAQILINLSTPTSPSTTILDPFCGTGVILQEALLMGYSTYGSDLSQKMLDYTQQNLLWLAERYPDLNLETKPVPLELGDATTHHWQITPPLAIASEIYLGQPLSSPPNQSTLNHLKTEAATLVIAFLKNLSPQIPQGTSLALAIPAWLRPDGSYEMPDILDEIAKLNYNVKRYRYVRAEDFIYHRKSQVVARKIIVLRKK
ncbi:hypothetical protein IKF15_02470 [Candidatus Saccharibacteria bacterium]|nr:hypothetical protein [Candidatus Saccharibacteria bacterium]